MWGSYMFEVGSFHSFATDEHAHRQKAHALYKIGVSNIFKCREDDFVNLTVDTCTFTNTTHN